MTTSESAASGRLAVLGGPKTVTAAAPVWPCFSDDDIEAVRQTMLAAREGEFALACSAAGGGAGEALEEALCAQLGRLHTVATCGGGPALHIACLAAGIGLGDEAITTPYSWGQTAGCILQCGGIPVFADIDPRTLQLDPECLDPLISERTKAIVVVDVFGIPADMDAILEVAARHDLIVIEDCAQAQGSRYKGQLVGTRAHISCFSMGSGKNVAAGDAGALVTDDRELYEKAVLAGMHPTRMRQQVQSPALRQRIDSFIFTYRVNTLSASLALNQMKRLEEMNDWRRRNAAYLRAGLEGVPGIRPLPLTADCDPAWHMIPWTFAAEDLPGVTREQYGKALAAEGVPITCGYVRTPFHLRHLFQEREWWLGHGQPWAASPRADRISYRQGDCPVAEERCAELDLMMGGGKWMKDVAPLLDQIIAAFHKVTQQAERLGEVKVD